MNRKNTVELKPVNGEWRNERLRFVNILMERFDETPRELGIRMGMTKQGVIHILKVDDCLLSKAHDIVNCHNCKLEISLTPPERGLFEDGNVTIDLTNLAKDDFDKYSNSRTYFIRKAMSQSGHNMITLQRAMKKCGMQVEVPTLRYWFGNQDDLYISWVYKIAEALHSEVKVNITAMTEEEIEANPWKDRLAENMKKLSERTYRVGRKPNWLKILEQEYTNDPEGLQKAIEERQRDEDIRKQLRQEKKALREKTRQLQKEVREFNDKASKGASAR